MWRVERRERARGEAGEVMKRFLATASHEPRMQLTSILGWARMLRAGELPEASAPRGLEGIGRNARAQARFVDDLLAVLCIASDTLRLEVALVGPAAQRLRAAEEPQPPLSQQAWRTPSAPAHWACHAAAH